MGKGQLFFLRTSVTSGPWSECKVMGERTRTLFKEDLYPFSPAKAQPIFPAGSQPRCDLPQETQCVPGTEHRVAENTRLLFLCSHILPEGGKKTCMGTQEQEWWPAMAVSATKKLERPRCDFMASEPLDEPQRGARHCRLFKEQLFWGQLTW